jgi:hypothetical protein
MSEITLVHVISSDTQLCKTISAAGVSGLAKVPYHVEFSTVEFESVQDLHEILDELRLRRDLCVLRGEPIEGRPVPCRRLLHADVGTGEAATLRAVPRDWVCLDFDSVPAIEGKSFAEFPQESAEHLRATLPAEFHATACVWHATGSAGVKPGIRAHLWFLLDQELDTAALTTWLQGHCDPTTFRAAQVHYTADPIFADGYPDPMTARIGMLAGAERVAVPTFEAPPVLVPPTPSVGIDPLQRRAMNLWAAEHAADLAEYVPGSARLPCPACTSSDGIAVREDGRWNCHGGKHSALAPLIGSATGNVYVGHPVEFCEGIERGGMRDWLRERYPDAFKFGGGLKAKVTAERTVRAVEQASKALSALVEGAPLDSERPSVRELEKATVELSKAAKVVKGNPLKIKEIAADMGRYVPLFLDQDQVCETLITAVLDSPTHVVTRPNAEALIKEGILIGRESPIVAKAPKRAELTYDEFGLARCQANVTTLLAGSEEVCASLMWDARQLAFYVRHAPPWYPDDTREFPRELEDSDYVRMVLLLAGDEFGYPHATSGACREAVQVIAAENSVDPIREYLDGLEWEGTLDEARELLGLIWIEWAGAEDNAYTRAVSMRWMIAAVQRTFEPGCQHREVLTLLGPQNIGKSRMLASLCPHARFFSDTNNADGSKDSRSGLLGTWIVELAEVDKHIREERTGAFKNFLSTQVDHYRRAYAHLDDSIPRRCVFAATSNAEQPFKDSTGNTRFNVLRVTRGDQHAVAAARDELWAAAVALYRSGEPAYLQGDERLAAVAEQRSAYAATETEELVRELWERPAPKLDARANWGTAKDSPLGFFWAPEQLDSERMFVVLTTQQIMDYLNFRNCRTNNYTNQAVNHACTQLGLVAGKISRSIPALQRLRGYWKP